MPKPGANSWRPRPAKWPNWTTNRVGQDAPRLVFRVEDVETARKALTGWGVRMGQYRLAAPGMKVCEGYDPEGNTLSIKSRQET